MAESKKKSVGVIGLGIIGSRVAAALRRTGFSVTVWNRSPRPEPNFLPSAREVAETADILQIFVRDGVALLEVIRAISPALGASHIVMNHATVGPAETLEAARLVAEHGAAFLDAPFTGSRDAAAEGGLVYYIGGEASVLERARPVLKSSSKAILPMGPIGAATYVKEALEQNVANSGVLSAKLPLMLSGDFEPRFSVNNMLKDLQIALRSVEGKGISLPTTAATAGALMGAVQAGWGGDDFASLSRHYAYSGSLKNLAAKQESSESPDEKSPAKKENSSSAKKGLFGLFGRSKTVAS
jgi:3-hydroxyisobutyrate dehydrogenase-like beta-hydroxyacid dehydrogenase